MLKNTKLGLDYLLRPLLWPYFYLKDLNLWMRADGPSAVFAKCLPYFYQNENYIVLKIYYMAKYSNFSLK